MIQAPNDSGLFTGVNIEQQAHLVDKLERDNNVSLDSSTNNDSHNNNQSEYKREPTIKQDRQNAGVDHQAHQIPGVHSPPHQPTKADENQSSGVDNTCQNN